MANFDAEKAYGALTKKLDEIASLLEVMTIVSAVSAGIPSTKIREILKNDQAKVSNISKLITGRASPTPAKGKAK